MGSNDFSIAFPLFLITTRICIDIIVLRELQIAGCLFFCLSSFFTHVVFVDKSLLLFK